MSSDFRMLKRCAKRKIPRASLKQIDNKLREQCFIAAKRLPCQKRRLFLEDRSEDLIHGSNRGKLLQGQNTKDIL